jgi:hypothetical protein
MIPALFAKIGVPVIAGVLSKVLGGVNDPVAQTAAEALGNLNLKPDQIAEANRHVEAVMTMELAQQKAVMAEINKSLRAEIASDDAYVRRMRPTFGYIMALTWAAQMFGIAYIMIFRTSEAGVVFQAANSLSVIWTVGLSVLGVYVYKRSEEKKS